MVKHGPEGFDFIVLEYCEIEKLDERESFWINQLQSLYPLGYNLTTGGGAFHKHNEETKRLFSESQKKRVKSGDHIFTDPIFQDRQRKHQIEIAKQGLHSSQSTEFQEKRNMTVRRLINEKGAFFHHTPDEIERKRREQIELYAKGLGKFQQPEFIEKNRRLVKEKIMKGEHHTQQVGWSAKAIESKREEMKPILLCIRTPDGQTQTKKFESINDAVRKLDARKKSISDMCNQKGTVGTISCNVGRIIKGAFGLDAPWNQDEVESIPESSLTRKMCVEVTILKDDGQTIVQTHESQRSACRDLGANHRALRFMLKGEKYKSTSCNLGRIIAVREIE
jgi:group I intron endonuclease